jgi:hypothetical protein
MESTDFERWLAGIFGQSTEQVSQLLKDPTAVRFLITWSIFETVCFKREMKIDEIRSVAERVVETEEFDVSSIREDAQQFHLRYQNKQLVKNLIHDGKEGPRRPTIKMMNETINPILKLTFDRLNDIQIVVLSNFVVYRFRNNIFHGNKDVTSWLQFKEQIDRCTSIMQRLISHAEKIQPQLKDV